MRCKLGNAATQCERYIYGISSNAPRECDDVVPEGGVVFVATGLDTGVDDM
jgi:hypothetical protein